MDLLAGKRGNSWCGLCPELPSNHSRILDCREDAPVKVALLSHGLRINAQLFSGTYVIQITPLLRGCKHDMSCSQITLLPRALTRHYEVRLPVSVTRTQIS